MNFEAQKLLKRKDLDIVDDTELELKSKRETKQNMEKSNNSTEITDDINWEKEFEDLINLELQLKKEHENDYRMLDEYEKSIEEDEDEEEEQQFIHKPFIPSKRYTPTKTMIKDDVDSFEIERDDNEEEKENKEKEIEVAKILASLGVNDINEDYEMKLDQNIAVCWREIFEDKVPLPDVATLSAAQWYDIGIFLLFAYRERTLGKEILPSEDVLCRFHCREYDFQLKRGFVFEEILLKHLQE